MKRLLILIGVALAVFWIVTAPAGAAATITGIGNWLYGLATNVTTFLVSLIPSAPPAP